MVYPEGLTVYPQALIVYPEGSTVYPETLIVYPEGLTVYPETLIVYPQSLIVYPEGLIVYRNASIINNYTSTTSVLLRKSCKVLSRKGIKNISIMINRAMLRNKT